MNQNKTRVGISVLSLMPWSLGPFGPDIAWWIAKKAGLDGLQLVPLRGWSEGSLQRLPTESVISYEGDWGPPKKCTNPDIKRRIIDVVAPHIFGKTQVQLERFKRLFPAALAVDINPNVLKEISPGNGKHIEDFLYPKGIVFDTWHIREFSLDHPLRNDTRNYVKKAPIKLLHLQTRNEEELESTLEGKQNFLTDMIRLVFEYHNVDVIIELSPKALLTRNPFETLERLREVILSYR